MEHRQAQRESAEITVLLNTADGLSCKGQIRDVSSLGAGIVLYEGNLTRGAMVKLQVLSTRQQGDFAVHSLGYVVRQNDNELGILWVTNDELTPMFGNIQYDEMTPLQKFFMV